MKTRVALLTQIRFAAVNKLGRYFLDGHLVLTSLQNDKEIFYKIDNLNNRFFVHHFRICDKKEVGESLFKYMRLSYQVGRQERTKRKIKEKKR